MPQYQTAAICDNVKIFLKYLASDMRMIFFILPYEFVIITSSRRNALHDDNRTASLKTGQFY